MNKLRIAMVACRLACGWLVFAGGGAYGQGDQLLRVHFVDVGQGDAIWIQGPTQDTGPGINVIIDGGPDKGSSDRLITYLEKYGLKKGATIDYVILTHPHNDHYPGLVDVLADYEVKTIVDSGYPSTDKGFQKFVTAAEHETVKGKKSQFIQLREKPDFQLNFGDELQARILHVDSAAATNMGSDNTRVNNASTVIRMVYKNFSFLFTGDAEGKARQEPATTEKYVEKELVDKFSAAELQSTVLKAGHHGSETSSTLAFIREVHPEVVVIESGRKSFSGTFLPDKSVIARYQSEFPGITIARTDENDEAEGRTTMTDADGDDVLVFTDGDSLEVDQAEGPVGHRKWVKLKTIQH
jgi:competence protein ComEC